MIVRFLNTLPLTIFQNAPRNITIRNKNRRREYLSTVLTPSMRECNFVHGSVGKSLDFFTVMLFLWEFAKSGAMCAIRASVVYVPNACQLLIFTCQ